MNTGEWRLFLTLVVYQLQYRRICLRLATTSNLYAWPDRERPICGAKTRSTKKWERSFSFLGGVCIVALPSPKMPAQYIQDRCRHHQYRSIKRLLPQAPEFQSHLVLISNELDALQGLQYHDQRHCVAMHEGPLRALEWWSRFHPHTLLVQCFAVL